MVLGQLENLLFEQGFYKVSSNLPEFVFFFHAENAYINVLQVIDYRQGLYISQDQYGHIKEKIKGFFIEKGISDVHILSLLISADIGKAKQLCGEDAFCWIINPMENRLMIYENQISDFYGMKDVLEKFLYEISNMPYEEADLSQQQAERGRQQLTMASIWETIRNLSCWGNILLVASNVLIYIVCSFTGSLLYNMGDFSIVDVITKGEWYRIITSMFLHVDINHLVSNMLILYYIGNAVEKYMGCIPYIIIYFLSGIAGNIVSAGYELLSGSYVSSVGASGAVFGIEGALLMLVLIYKGRCVEMTAGRLMFAIAFSLYCGFTSSNINNAAHIGGLLAGFTAAGICWLLIPAKRKKKAGK